MTDAELRALVREAVSRHLGRPAAPVVGPQAPPVHRASQGHASTGAWQAHASHHLYLGLANVDGSCVIEPSVACDHCGYCKSHGH